MKKSKQSSKLDFSNMKTLGHQPFAELGKQWGIEKDPTAEAAPSASPDAPDEKAQLLIRKERRRGHKWVTVIYHLDGDSERYLKPLKKRFASGGGMDEGKIILQGDHVNAVAAWFQERGYKTRQV